MAAYMNAEALAKTIATGEAWFWSRSRKTLWRKGETSGNTLTVLEMRVDCDQDAILLKVEVAGAGENEWGTRNSARWCSGSSGGACGDHRRWCGWHQCSKDRGRHGRARHDYR
jgi:hypothetical protein